MGRQFFKNVDFSVTYPLKGVQVTFGDSFFVGQCEVFVCLGFGHFILFVYFFPWPRSSKGPRMGRQFFKNVDFSVTYPLKGVQVTFGDSFFVGQCEVFVCLGFGHFILFVYFFPWPRSSKGPRMGRQFFKNVDFSVTYPLKGVQVTFGDSFFVGQCEVFVCLGFGHFILFVYFFPWPRSSKGPRMGRQFFKNVDFSVTYPLKGVQVTFGDSFFVGQCEVFVCLGFGHFILFVYFFPWPRSSKGPRMGRQFFKNVDFSVTYPLKGVQVTFGDSFFVGQCEVFVCLGFGHFILFVYFFPWPRSSKGPRMGRQFFKNVDFSVTYPLKGVQVTFGDSFFVGQCEVFVCLGFGHFILFVYFFPWPRSSKGPRMGRQFFKNVDFSVTYPLKGVQVTFGDSFFVGQCEVFVCLGFGHFILFVYFFPWPRSSKGPRMGRQFFKNVDFSVTYPLKGVQVTFGDSFFVGQCEVFVCLGFGHFILFVYFFPWPRSSKGPRMGRQFFKNVDFSVTYPLKGVQVTFGDSFFVGQCEVFVCLGFGHFILFVYFFPWPRSSKGPRMGRQFFKNVDFSVTYPLKGVQVTFGDSFFVGQCEVFVCLGFGHFILFVYFFPWPRSSKGPRMGRQFFKNVDFSVTYPLKGVQVTFGDSFFVGQCEVFVCLGFGHFILFVYFFPWPRSSKGPRMGRQFFKNVDFSVTYPLKGVQVTFGDSFFVGQCEVFVCLGFGHFILFVYFFPWPRSSKGPRMGRQFFKNVDFSVTYPLKGVQVTFGDSFFVGQCEVFVCLGFGHFILFVYFFPWPRSSKGPRMGRQFFKNVDFSVTYPLKGVQVTFGDSFFVGQCEVFVCLGFGHFILFVYFFRWPRSSKGPRMGRQFFKNVDFSVTYPLKGVQVTFGDSFFVGQCEVFVCLGFGHFILIVYFFPWPRSSKGPRMGRQFFKNVDFSVTYPLKGVQVTFGDSFFVGQCEVFVCLGFGHFILFVYFFPWPRSSKGPRMGRQFFKNVDFSVTYPLKGVQVTFGDSFFVGQCEVFVCLGFGHFILFVYFFRWPRSSKGPRMGRQFFKNVDFSVTYPLKGVQVTFGDSFFVGQCEVFVCLGFGHFILFVYFFPWPRSSKGPRMGRQFFKNVDFSVTYPLKGVQVTFGDSFFVGQCEVFVCLGFGHFILFVYFFPWPRSSKGPRMGSQFFKNVDFSVTYPLKGVQVTFGDSFFVGQCEVFVCLGFGHFILIVYFFPWPRSSKGPRMGRQFFKNVDISVTYPFKGVQVTFGNSFFVGQCEVFVCLGFGHFILFVYFFPWPRSSKGPRMGRQFFKNVDFSVTYPLKGVQVTFGDSFFVGQCEVFVYLIFGHFILFVYFFRWPRSSKGPRMGRQFFKNVDFSVTYPLKGVQVTFGDSFFVGQCEVFVCLGFGHFILFVYFFPWLRSSKGPRMGRQFFKNVDFSVTYPLKGVQVTFGDSFYQ